MDWTCKKCGKTLEVSEEQLHEMQGVVICPQCLGSERVPGYRHKSDTPSSRSSSNDSTSARQSSPPPVKSSPPPYRKKTYSVERNTTTTAAPKTSAAPKKKKKKRKKRGILAPHSSWGCFWRAILYTLALLAIASAAGFILDFI